MKGVDQITLDEAAAALAYIDAGDRDTWVRMAMALKTEFGDVGFDVWDEWSATDDRYKPGDARSVWRSVRPGPVSIGSLIHLAKEAGWARRAEPLTEEERARRERVLADQRREREARLAQEEARRAEWQRRVARVAGSLWEDYCRDSGVSEYVGRKQIKPCGARFVASSVVVVTDLDRETVQLVTGGAAIKAFFDGADQLDKELVSFKYLKRGTLVVPLLDQAGAIWNLQLIFPTGKKSFLKCGRKSGCYFFIPGDPAAPILVAEGYATAASLHMATGYGVAVAFDAGNLLPVARTLRNLYPDSAMVIAGDDDAGNPDNPGREKAEAAARAVNAVALFPRFRGAA